LPETETPVTVLFDTAKSFVSTLAGDIASLNITLIVVVVFVITLTIIGGVGSTTTNSTVTDSGPKLARRLSKIEVSSMEPADGEYETVGKSPSTIELLKKSCKVPPPPETLVTEIEPLAKLPPIEKSLCAALEEEALCNFS